MPIFRIKKPGELTTAPAHRTELIAIRGLSSYHILVPADGLPSCFPRCFDRFHSLRLSSSLQELSARMVKQLYEIFLGKWTRLLDPQLFYLQNGGLMFSGPLWGSMKHRKHLTEPYCPVPETMGRGKDEGGNQTLIMKTSWETKGQNPK